MSDALGEIINGAAGSAQGKEGTTVQTLALSCAAGFVLFGVQFGAFLIVRNYLWAKRIYQPRSFLIPLKDRVKPPPNNPFKWITTLLQIPPETVRCKAGMDAYFFLRYLAMCLKIFGPAAVLILPILIPLNYVDGKGTKTVGDTHYNVTGLDTLAWSNVALNQTDRYWAHLVLAILLIAWVCFLFYHELYHYVVKRQEYLSSPSHRLKASSTTVLITSIPKKLCTTAALMDLYDDFPGGVRRIWLNRDYEPLKTSTSGSSIQIACEEDLQHDLATGALWTEYLLPKQREHMWIPQRKYAIASRIPLVGRFFSLRVDTIYYCRRELARLNRELEAAIEDPDSYPRNGSAFIQFNTQKGAHIACQAVAETSPGRMTHRMVELSPADINWSALNYSRENRAVRFCIFLVLFVVLVFVYGLISFFTGILSKLSTLSDSTSWLRWISSLPSWLLSFIQGALPPVILVLILSGPTPIVLRAMTNGTRGATTGSQGERSLQLWYFILLLFELFIVPTISSGLTSIVEELLHNVVSVPEILATNLPTAANYYFSFLVLQALSISSSSILQTIRLLNYYVFGSVNTPDGVFHKLSFTWRTRIGSNIPWYTTFTVIGLVYAVIAPLMLVFMLLTFSLFYIVIKNNVLYVVRTGDVDSGGIWFPSAINQTFTGLYFMEFCMIGLFFLVRDTDGEVACEAQGIIMSVVVIATILYQIWLAVNFNGLYKYAPLRLEGEAQLRDREYEATRLAANLAQDRPESKETVESSEKTVDVAGKSNAATHQTKDLAPASFQTLRQRHAAYARSLSTAGLAPLSEDVEAQREHDHKEAKQILARLNRPLDESRLAELESHLAQVEARVGNTLIPRQRDVERQMFNDPISKIIMQHNDELEDISREERDMLLSVAFTHPVLRQARPAVWIPKDELGVSDDEVKRTRELSGDLTIDNRGAFFDRRLKVRVDRQPPDMSEFTWVMAEL
ncbi:hypothetical protein DV738_g634, partial [Chaetothyriales sp. CBS 135597]